MSAWIKCSERMPEAAESVLAYTVFGTSAVATWTGWEWRMSARYVGGRGWAVAWQPLPEPPSESTDAPLEPAKAAMDAAERKANDAR